MNRLTKNRTHYPQRDYCNHCNNTGQICIDADNQTHHGWMAPCPMCEHGRFIEYAQYPTGYWNVIRRGECTWQNGLDARYKNECTVQSEGSDYPCHRPSVGDVCDNHLKQQGATPVWA